jgi:hypothetical protein
VSSPIEIAALVAARPASKPAGRIATRTGSAVEPPPLGRIEPDGLATSGYRRVAPVAPMKGLRAG